MTKDEALRIALEALDQAANGSLLDDISNHSDDGIRLIAWSLGPGWARTKLLDHAERLEMAEAYLRRVADQGLSN